MVRGPEVWMDAKSVLKSLVKVAVTVGIFVALFLEVGGGAVEVDRAQLTAGTLWKQPNPETPGLIARLRGAKIPEPALVPVPADTVCKVAAEKAIFATTRAGEDVRIKVLGHCEHDQIARALATPDGDMTALATLPDGPVYLVKQGFQLVPLDWDDLWREVTSIDASVFVPWFLFATLIKLLGIFANIYRWQILLRGQDIQLGFTWLSSSYFVGRYFGIVTPSTMGLDGWRLYDTMRVTRRPIECATALAIERLIGLVGLFVVILMFMPFADLGDRSLGQVAQAMAVPLFAGSVFGVLLLLQPAWFSPLIAMVPHRGAAAFLKSAIDAATAYSSRRSSLLIALACAVFGQVTTMFMYFGNAMALQVEGVTMAQVLYASAVMTLGTFLAPSASGEGVREIVFVALLGGRTTAAKAFLIGHLGFWIEKLPLSIPGGLLMLWAPDDYKRITKDDLDRLREETRAEATGAA